MTKYSLKLYVTGKTPRSERAIANLRVVCERDLQGRCETKVIDVVECPELAEDEHILATPTLVKESPPPVKRIIGDLCDSARVLLGLGIASQCGGDT